MKILVPVDDRVFAEIILQFLKKQDWPKGSTFRILHVLTPVQTAFAWPSNVLRMDAQSLVNAVAENFKRSFPHDTVDTLVADGGAAKIIEQQAEAWPADLIAMGSHSRSNLGKKFIGSVSGSVAMSVKCPVITLRPPLASAANGKTEDVQPIWLEEMSTEHEKYFLEHLGEHPFPLDGTDWCRLVSMRLEHEFYHKTAGCKGCADLFTQLHALGTPLAHERQASWRAFQHWFSEVPAEYAVPIEGQDDAAKHAMKVLSQVDKNAHLKAAERQWLKERIKEWMPSKLPYWAADRAEAWESGLQTSGSQPRLKADELPQEVSVNAPQKE